MKQNNDSRHEQFVNLYDMLKNKIMKSLQDKYQYKMKKLIPGSKSFTHFVPKGCPYRALILLKLDVEPLKFIGDFIKEFNNFKSRPESKYPANIRKDYGNILLIVIDTGEISLHIHINQPHYLFTRNLIRKYLFSSKTVTQLTYYLICFGLKKEIIDPKLFTYQAFLIFIIYVLQRMHPQVLPIISLERGTKDSYDRYFVLAELQNTGRAGFSKWARVTKNKMKLENSNVESMNVGHLAFCFFEALNRLHLLRFTKVSITNWHDEVNIHQNGLFIENPYNPGENETKNVNIIISPKENKEENGGPNKLKKPVLDYVFKSLQLKIKKACQQIKNEEYNDVMTVSHTTVSANMLI